MKINQLIEKEDKMHQKANGRKMSLQEIFGENTEYAKTRRLVAALIFCPCLCHQNDAGCLNYFRFLLPCQGLCCCNYADYYAFHGFHRNFQDIQCRFRCGDVSHDAHCRP